MTVYFLILEIKTDYVCRHKNRKDALSKINLAVPFSMREKYRNELDVTYKFYTDEYKKEDALNYMKIIWPVYFDVERHFAIHDMKHLHKLKP